MKDLRKTDYFNDALHHFGRKGEELFVLNIGAMDGITFDEMAGYLKSYAFKGLFVEPIRVHYEQLRENFSEEGHLFENAAIAEYDGEIEMLTIDHSVIKRGLVHLAFSGMSAVYPPKNGLGSEQDRQVVENYGQKVTVPCITFKTLLEKHGLKGFDVIKIDAEGYDYRIFKQIDLKKYRPKVIRVEWSVIDEFEKEALILQLEDAGYVYGLEAEDIVGIPAELYHELYAGKVTLVTGLWDIRRDTLSEGWSRSYDFYLEKFRQLLDVPNNLIVFGDQHLREFVFTVRSEHNTQFIERTQDWFINEFYETIQAIRTDQNWYTQAAWLAESTQARLAMYNPLVLSKPFLLHDAKLLDRFHSTHLYWIDAGITNTVHPGYFTHDLVIDQLSHLTKLSFIAFPYAAADEIHGFNYSKLNELAGARVNKVCRGGFFGGPVAEIPQFNGEYYQLLESTLREGFMGTEESLFTILLYKYPKRYQYFGIEENGLIATFFENVKNKTAIPLNELKVRPQNTKSDKVALYVLTYNSPRQLETLLASMKQYDEQFITEPHWILLNNSTDASTTPAYEKICEQFGIEHIQKDNIGICGGRQWIAEHAAANDFDYYFFFEDDMFFYTGDQPTCRNGFIRKVKDLYHQSLEIMQKEGFDFLKFNFTEFYGDHQLQWSWHNVPQEVRAALFQEKPTKVSGDPAEAPDLNFKNVKSLNGLAYATGEVYYCNWPQLVSKEGNRKLFLDVKWERPYEQTWMSYAYQETVKGKIKPAVLLATPTEHNRFDFYAAEERREN